MLASRSQTVPFIDLRTAKITNEWVLNKAGVNRELIDTVKARKLA